MAVLQLARDVGRVSGSMKVVVVKSVTDGFVNDWIGLSRVDGALADMPYKAVGREPFVRASLHRADRHLADRGAVLSRADLHQEGEGVMLSVKGLSAGYGRKTVLRSIDVDALEPGTVTAFLGQNGAGKSTLLRSLAGLHKAEGSFALFDADITRQSAAQRARQITYMPHSLPHSVALTVLEATIGALRASSRDPDAVKRSLAVLDRLGIQSLAMSQLDSLSGGQRQLASLAQALVRKPQVLLLDEPTSALDVAHQIRVMRTIKEITREQNIISIAVLHDLALASRWCERLVLLSGGRVVSDREPAAALTTDVLRTVYGVEARIQRCSRGQIQVVVDDIA